MFKVPDLVFSEMKFLQKNKDQPESAPPEGALKKKQKKEHTHTKEGEISAFFTSVRPALAEKDGNTLANIGIDSIDIASRTTRRERDQLSKADAIVPTTEVSEKGSFLGSGSRGPRHGSTSYVSWSDSVRPPSTTPRQNQCQPAVPESRYKSTKHHRDGDEVEEDNTVSKWPMPPSVSRRRTGATAERFGVSSITSSQHGLSRSQSYPHHTSSPRRVNLVDRAAKFQMTDPVASPSSLPPFKSTRASVEPHRIEPVAGSTHASPRSHAAGISKPQQDLTNDEEKAFDTEAQTSSDLGKVLQQCNDIFNERRQAMALRRRQTVRSNPSRANDDLERQPQYIPYPKLQEVRTVRFSGVGSRSPRPPTFSGPSIYEQQAQRQRVPVSQCMEDSLIYEDKHLAAQNYAGEESERTNHDQMQELFGEVPDSYGVDSEEEPWGVGDSYASEGVVQHLQSDNSVVASGFWRPNKLY
jgi:hypothetical protein